MRYKNQKTYQLVVDEEYYFKIKMEAVKAKQKIKEFIITAINNQININSEKNK